MNDPVPMSLKEAFSSFPSLDSLDADIREVVYILATENISEKNYLHYRPRVLLSKSSLYKKQIVGLILFYVKNCVRDHVLLPQEKNNIRLLNTLFKIRDGEYYRRQRKMLSDVLSQQILWIIRDGRIERTEDIFQTDLQRIFSLGTDQLNALTRPAVMAFLRGITKENNDEWKERVRKIRTAYLIHEDDL